MILHLDTYIYIYIYTDIYIYSQYMCLPPHWLCLLPLAYCRVLSILRCHFFCMPRGRRQRVCLPKSDRRVRPPAFAEARNAKPHSAQPDWQPKQSCGVYYFALISAVRIQYSLATPKNRYRRTSLRSSQNLCAMGRWSQCSRAFLGLGSSVSIGVSSAASAMSKQNPASSIAGASMGLSFGAFGQRWPQKIV